MAAPIYVRHLDLDINDGVSHDRHIRSISVIHFHDRQACIRASDNSTTTGGDHWRLQYIVDENLVHLRLIASIPYFATLPEEIYWFKRSIAALAVSI